MMEPEIELVLYLLIAFAIASGLFYGMAFVVQRVKLLWIEIESNRIDMLAKRAHVKIALDQNDLQTQVITLDTNGLPPVSRKMIDSGLTTQATMQAVLAYIESNRTHAPTPTHLTYAPHIKGGDAHLPNPAGLLEAPMFKVADFFQLYQSDQLPKDKLLIGYDLENEQPIEAGWGSLYSALIGGYSGSGKSTLIRGILAQSALQGGRFVVLDPHYSSGDESLGASLLPLRSRMPFDVAHDDQTMLQALGYVADVGRNRLAGRDMDRTPLVLIVDETTALLQRGAIAPELTNTLAMIAQETRKVSIYALCIGQNFSSEIMPTTARNSFVSMISCRARRDVARTQSGNAEFGRIAQELTTGQAVWMAPSGEVKRLAIPNCTQRHLESVGAVISAQKGPNGVWSATSVKSLSKPFPNPFQTPQDEGDPEQDWNDFGKGLETNPGVILDAKAQRAISMFASGKSLAAIVKEIWGVHTGRAYQEAHEELQAILRSQIGGGAR